MNLQPLNKFFQVCVAGWDLPLKQCGIRVASGLYGLVCMHCSHLNGIMAAIFIVLDLPCLSSLEPLYAFSVFWSPAHQLEQPLRMESFRQYLHKGWVHEYGYFFSN